MKPYPYPEVGARWLATNKRALLLDEMGLGKTPQALIAAAMCNARSIGVICPAIARTNWRREFDRWVNSSADFFVESYDKVVSRDDVRKQMMNRDILIIDEGHYLKNRTAKRVTAIYGRHACGDGIVATCKKVWVLTGTPAPNDASELWTHFRALFSENLTFRDWVKRYCSYRETQFGIQIMGNNKINLPELKAKLKAVSLRRVTSEVMAELPAIIWQDVIVDAKTVKAESTSDEAVALRLLLDSLGPEGDEQAAEELARAAPHMAQIRRLTGLAKAPAVAEMVAEELDNGGAAKVLIFAHHRDVISELNNLLTKYNPVAIVGNTADDQRVRAMDAFQTDPNCRVFIGQKEVVKVKMVGLADSLDEAVTRVLARKARAVSQILED